MNDDLELLELPPLVGTLAQLSPDARKVVQSYGRACAAAAISADRQRRAQAAEPSLTDIGAFLKRCDPRLVIKYLADDVNLRIALWLHFSECEDDAAPLPAAPPIPTGEGQGSAEQ